MAYAGYRLKIDGDVFPNEYISRGSYSISNSPRVCDTYVDSLGISHNIYYPSSKAVITFAIKEHSTEEHPTLDAFFSVRDNVEIEYYDDNTDSYVEGIFTIKDFTWRHANALTSNVDYNSTQITLEEH